MARFVVTLAGGGTREFPGTQVRITPTGALEILDAYNAVQGAVGPRSWTEVAEKGTERTWLPPASGNAQSGDRPRETATGG